MDWKHLTFDWSRARAFLATAEEGSFSGAGRVLGLAQPTVGRQVAALETELGVTLFERIGTRLELTEAALDLVEPLRQMRDAAERVALAAAGQAQSVDGPVRLGASEAVAAYILPWAVQAIRERHPGIQVEVVASNSPSDLLRREADIAIRNFRPKEPDLVARKLPDRWGHLFASTAYLERHGPFDTLDDLTRAHILGFDRTALMTDGLRAMGVPVHDGTFPVICESHLVQWQLARAGVGICFIMDEVARTDPDMQAVLPEHIAMPVPMWVTSHRELRTARRIRVVFDLLVELLADP